MALDEGGYPVPMEPQPNSGAQLAQSRLPLQSPKNVRSILDGTDSLDPGTVTKGKKPDRHLKAEFFMPP